MELRIPRLMREGMCGALRMSPCGYETERVLGLSIEPR